MIAGRLSDSVQEIKEVAARPPLEIPAPGPSPDLENVKRDVAALKAANPDEDKLVLARHELETISEATDNAANEIINQSDEIEKVIEKIREEMSTGDTADLEAHCATLEAVATNLLMACGFQDLTGQRMTKVTNTLHTLEDQIDNLFATLEITEGTGTGGMDAVTAACLRLSLGA